MKKENLENWEAKTELEKDVKKMISKYINECGYDYIKDFYKDFFEGGLASGMITEIVYDEDINKFYEKHKDEIQNIMQCSLISMEAQSLEDIFREDYDRNDYFCNDNKNKRNISWYAFERVAIKIYNDLRIEI